MDVIGHSENDFGEIESLALHLKRVARYARSFGELLHCPDEAVFASFLHDAGKLGPAFAERLRGTARGVDHWSFGAWLACCLAKQNSLPSVLAILGHHAGLTAYTGAQAMRASLTTSVRDSQLEKEGKRLSYIEDEEAKGWYAANCLSPPSGFDSLCPLQRLDAEDGHCAAQVDVRMLFSILVDADYLATEGHFQAPEPGRMYVRPTPPALQPEKALACLDQAIEARRRTLLADGVAQGASAEMMALRGDLLEAAKKAGEQPLGPYTMTAPTGAGKTFAMLAFALQHAMTHGLKGRIIVVLPFLSIIEQTAAIYRDLFGETFPADYVLEHHSLAREEGAQEKEDDNGGSEARRRARMLTENWDAPIIVTTSVQFLESLFDNRPGRCRKLHRLAESVILFDEVQTLPTGLAVETLAALSHLTERYRTSVVFSTATQPAFSCLHEAVETLAPAGWQPREIVPKELGLFDRSRRTVVQWPAKGETLAWPELAARLADHEQVLCIVNLKRHALRLVEELKALGVDGLAYISTNMCPLHRKAALVKVRACLDDGRPCRLVATQCVEAGVDLDFPSVYRAFAPLDAIAQAAGRCNRSGRMAMAEVIVFHPDLEPAEKPYPPGGYEQAAKALEKMLKQREGSLDIHDPAVYEQYFKKLYTVAGVGRRSQESALRRAILQHDFPEIAKAYRLIDSPTISVLVPYDREAFQRLNDEVEAEGMTARWIGQARNHAVSLYRTSNLLGQIEPMPLLPAAKRRAGGEDRDGDRSMEWYRLLVPDAYDRELLGLQVSHSTFIA